MDLYAYIGEDENARTADLRRVGLKQAYTGAGMIPLVVVDYDLFKLERDTLLEQLQEQSTNWGRTIRLARFAYIEDVFVIVPRP